MHGDKRGHAETPQVFLSDLGARAFWRNHNHRQIVADLHALFDNIEAV